MARIFARLAHEEVPLGEFIVEDYHTADELRKQIASIMHIGHKQLCLKLDNGILLPSESFFLGGGYRDATLDVELIDPPTCEVCTRDQNDLFLGIGAMSCCGASICLDCYQELYHEESPCRECGAQDFSYIDPDL
mmetsp:Transcript_75034/g.160735  ORF Transcript_75034/g.160735 Transcript_75034/m.160735 type:complete len:135 (-) Transcript_75034:26-430(-)